MKSQKACNCEVIDFLSGREICGECKEGRPQAGRPDNSAIFLRSLGAAGISISPFNYFIEWNDAVNQLLTKFLLLCYG
jgi:hypothetical protein